jgi:pimeloyl-ACP methyl ester carboxylesterase
VKEKVFAFGTDDCLVGVLTEPALERKRAGAPAVVLFNVGINPRIGPFRIWVGLARALAEHGFTVLRFDLSGLGDSDTRRDTRTELERAAGDVREAMDFLAEKKGFSQMVLMGLCSGVDQVHAVSLVDPRVVGAVHIDGYNYRTRGFYLRRYTLEALNRRRWRLYLARRLRVLLHTDDREHREVGEAQEIYVREYPTPERLGADLEALLARGTKLLFIYSGTQSDYRYASQFYEMFQAHDFRSRIEADYYPRADHTFSVVTDRDALIRRLCGWMDRNFPGALVKREAAPPVSPNDVAAPALVGFTGSKVPTHGSG